MISNDYDESPLTLNADALAVATKNLTETLSNLNHLRQALAKGDISKGAAKNVLYLAESAIADIGKATGIETESEKEREERYAAIRAANLRVSELEKQVGAGLTPEAIKQSIAVLGERVSKWWRVYGLGYVPELQFSQYGVCRAELSGTLSGDFLGHMSDTPVSDKERRKQWIASLQEQGFVLDQTERSFECLIDCDQTRKALKELILRHFPTARIISYKNHLRDNARVQLRSVEVYIYNLEEIQNLDLPVEEVKIA